MPYGTSSLGTVWNRCVPTGMRRALPPGLRRQVCRLLPRNNVRQDVPYGTSCCGSCGIGVCLPRHAPSPAHRLRRRCVCLVALVAPKAFAVAVYVLSPLQGKPVIAVTVHWKCIQLATHLLLCIRKFRFRTVASRPQLEYPAGALTRLLCALSRLICEAISVSKSSTW